MEEKLKVFLAELAFQAEEIFCLHEKISLKKREFEKRLDDENIKESLAYKLHNLYCAYEDLFKLVANFFENQIESSERFHINLLKRMLIEITDLRPALLSRDTYKTLDELRAFRHLFRHAYNIELDEERVLKVAEKAEALKDLFKRDLNNFIERLKFMVKKEEEGDKI